MALKENFKDDIYSGNRKYNMINNGDGTVSLVDATTYTQVGDVVDAATLNAMSKAVNNLSVFQTPTGTGTAIVLQNVEFIDGKVAYFKVTAANGGAATTINGKNFYKPGGTTAPTLVVGNYVMAIYSLSGDCFFIRASASGDALPSHVLAGKTFGNNDGEQVGIMTDRTGTVLNANDKEALDNGTLRVTPQKGYYDGATAKSYLYDTNYKAGNFPEDITVFGLQGTMKKYKVDGTGVVTNGADFCDVYANGNVDFHIPTAGYMPSAYIRRTISGLSPANVKKGVVIGESGKSTFTGTLEYERYNFPCTISDVEPPIQRNGHIWIKSSTLGAKINQIKVAEYLTAETDGKVILVTGSMSVNRYLVNSFEMPLTDGSKKELSMNPSGSGNPGWLIAYRDNYNLEKIGMPVVYSKVDGVLDIETAYVVENSAWVQLSQKGSYVLIGNGTNGGVTPYNFNKSAGTLTAMNTTNVRLAMRNYSRVFPISRDGTYYVTADFKVYKRVGDVYSLYFTIPQTYSAGYTYNVAMADISPDGIVVVAYTYGDYQNGSYLVVAFKDNGTTMTATYLNAIPKIAGSGIQVYSILATANLGAIILVCTGASGNACLYYNFGGSGGFTAHTTTLPAGLQSTAMLSYDGSALFMNNNSQTVVRYTIHHANKAVYTWGNVAAGLGNYCFGVSPDSIVFFGGSADTTITAYHIHNNVAYTMSGFPSQSDSGGTMCISFNAAGDRAVISYGSYTFGLYSVVVDHSAKTIAFTLIRSVSTPHQVSLIALIPQ